MYSDPTNEWPTPARREYFISSCGSLREHAGMINDCSMINDGEYASWPVDF